MCSPASYGATIASDTATAMASARVDAFSFFFAVSKCS
jgi:hypothetical protein